MPDTNGTHGTHAGTRRITQSVSHRRRRTAHTTHNQAHNHLVPDPPRTHTRTTATRAHRRRYPGAIARSRPDPNAHARAHVNARGATPQSRPLRPNPRSQPNPGRPTLFRRNARGAGSRPGGRPLVLTCRLRTRDRERDHPSKCAAVQAVYFGPYSVLDIPVNMHNIVPCTGTRCRVLSCRGPGPTQRSPRVVFLNQTYYLGSERRGAAPRKEERALQAYLESTTACDPCVQTPVQTPLLQSPRTGPQI